MSSSSARIIKAIPSRNEDTDVAEIFSMVPGFGKGLPATVAHTEGNVCSSILMLSITKTKAKPR